MNTNRLAVAVSVQPLRLDNVPEPAARHTPHSDGPMPDRRRAARWAADRTSTKQDAPALHFGEDKRLATEHSKNNDGR